MYNLHYEKFADGTVKCIEDEIPFEIPESWEWCRLGSIIDFSRNNSIAANSISQDFWVLDLEDIEKDTGKLLRKKLMKDVQSKSDKHLFVKGNVLYSKLRPYLNKVIIADDDGVCTSEILVFDFLDIYNRYAQVYLMSPFFVAYAMSDAYGVKMPRLGSKQGNNALMPVPPLSEQLRIVDELDLLTIPLDHYNKSQIKLNKFNYDIKISLKKSILREAIRGKLVPQLREEGTAKDLLKQIRNEKEILVKEGKLKKSALTDSVIYKGDDNKYYEQIGKRCFDITEQIPCEIPKNWEWTRLSHIANIYTGNSISEAEKKLKFTNVVGRYYIGTKDVGFNNQIVYNNGVSIPKQYEQDFKIAPNNSILMCIEGGSAGRKIARLNQDVCFGNKLCCLSSFVEINEYIYYYIQSPLFFDMFNQSKKGIIGGVSIAKVKDLLIPLPPFSEQHRIIAQIEELFEQQR